MTYTDTKESIMNWRENNKDKYNEYMKTYMIGRHKTYGMKKDPEVYKAYMREYNKKRTEKRKLEKLEEKSQKIETI